MLELSCILFLVGLILIIIGGNYFVDTATWIAKSTGIPEVLIGATIVSLATTFPELMVSVTSSLHGHPEMALGNALGSVICNTGFILGLCYLIKPSTISSKIFTLKGIVLLIYLVVSWVIYAKKTLTYLDSAILIFLLIFYFLLNLSIVQYKKSNYNYQPETVVIKKWFPILIRFISGITLIILGAKLLVTHGDKIAHLLGIPESFISLTLIALSTSMPELITSVIALIKGHTGISIGNILGANILNLTMVIGCSSLVNSPMPVSTQTIFLDLPTAFLINSILIVPSIFTRKVSRFQAALILASYITYILLLVKIID